jgi:competence protein ComEA
VSTRRRNKAEPAVKIFPVGRLDGAAYSRSLDFIHNRDVEDGGSFTISSREERPMNAIRRILIQALVLSVFLVCCWSGPWANAQASGDKINLNSATEQQLEQLPGVGPATAKKIIAGRPYKSADDLSKAGISKSEIDKITPLVSVGASSGSNTPKGPPVAGNKVDLNSASQTELEELSGVGSATAKKIIAGRPYSSVDDLSKAGISKSTIAKITPLVSVGESATPRAAGSKQQSAGAAKVDLNSATPSELEELPGVGSATAKKIIAGRPYTSVDDLSKTGISKSEIAKITPLVSVGETTAAGAGAPKQKSAAAEKVDLNSATQSQLEDLPGVGTATAKKIIAGRPYKSVDDLSKSGISKTEIAKITPLVSVAASNESPVPAAQSGNVAEKIDLNAASQKELEELPGVGPATANKIIASRPYKSVDDLARAGVSKSEISKLTPLVSVGAETTEAQTSSARIPPQPGMVWVNTESKIYHREGDPWYGKTKKGKFMTEQEAIQQGYRASKSGSADSSGDNKK